MTRRILLSDSYNPISSIALVLFQTDVLVHPEMVYMCFLRIFPSDWSFYPNSSGVISRSLLFFNLLRPNLFGCRALHSKGASRRGPYLKRR